MAAFNSSRYNSNRRSIALLNTSNKLALSDMIRIPSATRQKTMRNRLQICQNTGIHEILYWQLSDWTYRVYETGDALFQQNMGQHMSGTPLTKLRPSKYHGPYRCSLVSGTTSYFSTSLNNSDSVKTLKSYETQPQKPQRSNTLCQFSFIGGLARN
jgi:hypothetical protein